MNSEENSDLHTLIDLKILQPEHPYEIMEDWSEFEEFIIPGCEFRSEFNF